MRIDATLLARCLEPLLQSLSWHGTQRTLYESLPGFLPVSSVKTFCDTLKNLGYRSQMAHIQLKNIDIQLLPCLFIPDTGSPKVLLTADAQGISFFDSATEKTEQLIPTQEQGLLIVFKKNESDIESINSTHWFKDALAPKKNSLYYIGFLTCIQVFLMLASPFFIMSVYDKVITTGSIPMLISFFIGVLMAMVALAIVMMIRSRLLAHLGSFVQRRVGDAIFRQLLKLPASYIESASTGMHIARLNDFNSVREFFSSSLFGTLIELPFLLIYFAVIWILADWLVLVPLIFMIIFSMAAYVLWYILQKNIHTGSMIKLRREEFLVETLQHMHSLQLSGMREKWRERFANFNRQSAVLSQKLAFINNAGDSIFDVLTMVAGLATLAAGVLSMLSETPGEHLQIGALIGVMFIIWRLLTPFKAIGVQLTKLTQLRRSIIQINNLMQLPREEAGNKENKNMPIRLNGEIAFSQVAFRYPNSNASTLLGVSFTLKPGQMLALIGPNSAGKSTIFKLLLAIYAPQLGHVFIDRRDIQQYDVALLRTQIAYVPQKAQLFYGTIAQNLRLSEPAATDEQLIQAAKEANLLKDVLALPEGFETRIKNYGDRSMSASFCQKISLARAYLRNAPILLMDEPSTALDDESTAMLLDTLKRTKGKQTVILITQRPSQIQFADIALVLQEGKPMMSGAPSEILEKMSKGML